MPFLEGSAVTHLGTLLGTPGHRPDQLGARL